MQEFIIRPNNSLTQREMLLLGGGFSLLLLLLAVRLLMMGFWPVVPFLLVDFLAVAVAFYWLRRKCGTYESINIDHSRLQIRHHEGRRSKTWSFDLHWVQVTLQEHEHPWQPSRLLVGSHGKWIELAGFLTNEERVSLTRALSRSIQKQVSHA